MYKRQPQVRAMDAVNPHDYAISKVRDAGFTTVCILPGSANVIGGTGIVIKLRDAQTAEEMILPGTEQMKFAMGENPKRCYGTDRKYPMTRMGLASLMLSLIHICTHTIHPDGFLFSRQLQLHRPDGGHLLPAPLR